MLPRSIVEPVVFGHRLRESQLALLPLFSPFGQRLALLLAVFMCRFDTPLPASACPRSRGLLLLLPLLLPLLLLLLLLLLCFSDTYERTFLACFH